MPVKIGNSLYMYVLSNQGLRRTTELKIFFFSALEMEEILAWSY